MKPVVVFGGTGFIGSHLVSYLLEAGNPVILITRRPLLRTGWADSPALECVCIPELQPSSEAFARVIGRTDVVYNLAGVSEPASSNDRRLVSLDGNCRLQCYFLQGCHLSGSRPRVVFSSSRLVYGRANGLPVTEKSELQPRSHYAAHKLCVEQYHEIAGARNEISYSICRISNAYGAFHVPHGKWMCQINAMLLRACLGEPIEVFGNGEQLRDYINVSDLVDALVLCGTSIGAKNEIFNIGSGQSTSINDAARIISEYTGVRVVHVPWSEDYELIETGDYVANIEKARKAIGFHPKREFDKSIQGIVAVIKSYFKHADPR
jgi:UDP-glucose 4-epimerase